MPGRGWIIAQFAVAAVLLVLSLVGIVGVAFGMAELVFSFAGGIHAYAVFPGLVLSLVVNALLMRRHRERGLSLTEKWMLTIEFALIAWLLVLHFWSHSGDALALAIVSWPVVVVLAIAIAAVAAARNGSRPPAVAAEAPPTPPEG